MVRALVVSEIGPSHIAETKPNQDFGAYSTKGPRWAVAIADGLGSKKYSHIGSRLAVEQVLGLVSEIPDQAPLLLAERLHQNWVRSIAAASLEPQDCGSTLLCAWGGDDGHFHFLQLGDGLICSTEQALSPSREESFGNITSSLGAVFKLDNWAFGESYLSDGDSLFLMTDGISEDLIEPLHFAREVNDFTSSKTRFQVKKWLRRELRNWATPHHSDDKTIAMVTKYVK